MPPNFVFSKMSKTIAFPFKLSLSRDAIQRLADFFNLQIVEKVATATPHPAKVSDTSYIHTYPQQTIETWAAKRHMSDDVENLKDTVGFHLKPDGINGTIYYVDNSRKVCECYFELSGVAAYDILVAENQLSEWFLPIKEKLYPAEKDKIIAEMKAWLAELKIKAKFY